MPEYRMEYRVTVTGNVWMGGNCHLCGRDGKQSEWRQYGDLIAEMPQILRHADAGYVSIEIEPRRVEVVHAGG